MCPYFIFFEHVITGRFFRYNLLVQKMIKCNSQGTEGCPMTERLAVSISACHVLGHDTQPEIAPNLASEPLVNKCVNGGGKLGAIVKCLDVLWSGWKMQSISIYQLLMFWMGCLLSFCLWVSLKSPVWPPTTNKAFSSTPASWIWAHPLDLRMDFYRTIQPHTILIDWQFVKCFDQQAVWNQQSL